MNKPQSGALFNDCAHLLTIYPRGVHFVLKQVSIFKAGCLEKDSLLSLSKKVARAAFF